MMSTQGKNFESQQQTICDKNGIKEDEIESGKWPTGLCLGPVKTFKYYSNRSLKEDPKECVSVGDGMENARKYLLERKKFSGVWCISVLVSLTALHPTLGM